MNEILQKAYDILEARGWCQRSLRDERGRVCLEGAVALASGGSQSGDIVMRHPGVEAAWGTLCTTIQKETGIDDISPWQWNDNPSTSVEDVKLMLKKAINTEQD